MVGAVLSLLLERPSRAGGTRSTSSQSAGPYLTEKEVISRTIPLPPSREKSTRVFEDCRRTMWICFRYTTLTRGSRLKNHGELFTNSFARVRFATQDCQTIRLTWQSEL